VPSPGCGQGQAWPPWSRARSLSLSLVLGWKTPRRYRAHVTCPDATQPSTQIAAHFIDTYHWVKKAQVVTPGKRQTRGRLSCMVAWRRALHVLALHPPLTEMPLQRQRRRHLAHSPSRLTPFESVCVAAPPPRRPRVLFTCRVPSLSVRARFVWTDHALGRPLGQVPPPSLLCAVAT